MIATGFPLCFCCPLKVERNLRGFVRPRQKLQKSSSATSDLVQWTARYGLLILMERNFITDWKLCLNPIVATPAPLCSILAILAPLCTRLLVRLWCKSVNEPRPRSEKAIGGNALVLCKRAHCASSANYPEESKPSPPASQIILCEIFFLDFMSFIPAAKVQLQSLISILIHWLQQIRPRSKSCQCTCVGYFWSGAVS